MILLAAAGWAFDERMWEPLRSVLAPHVLEGVEALKVETRAQELSSSGVPFLLLGFSLGAFLSFPLLSLPGVRGGVFCALAETFTRSEVNPAGATHTVLTEMMAGLGRAPAPVLAAFYRRCFKPQALVAEALPSKPPSAPEQLAVGLELLAHADLRGIAAVKPVRLLAGAHDRILPIEGPRLMARRRGLTLTEVPGCGHTLPISAPGPYACAVRELCATLA